MYKAHAMHEKRHILRILKAIYMFMFIVMEI